MICLSGCEKDYESGIGAMNISPFMLLLADISDSKDKLVVFRIYPSECRYHLIECNLKNEFLNLVCDFRYIDRKLRIFGIFNLLEDFQLLSDEVSNLVKKMLLQSAHILEQENGEAQLASQIVGRLGHYHDVSPEIMTLVSQAKGFDISPALVSQLATLFPAENPTIRTIPLENKTHDISISEDLKYLVIGDEANEIYVSTGNWEVTPQSTNLHSISKLKMEAEEIEDWLLYYNSNEPPADHIKNIIKNIKKKFSGHEKQCMAAMILRELDIVAILWKYKSLDGGSIEIFRLSAELDFKLNIEYSYPVNCVEINDSTVFYRDTNRGILLQVDWRIGKLLSSLRVNHWIQSLSIYDNLLCVGTAKAYQHLHAVEGAVKVVNLLEKKVVWETSFYAMSESMSIRINNIYLVARTDGNQLTCWRRINDQNFEVHLNIKDCPSFALFDDLLFTSGKSKIINIFNLQDNKKINQISVQNEPISFLVANHELLFVVSDDGQIEVWSWKTGILVKTFHAHRGKVTEMILESGLLFTSSYDKTIKVWDIGLGNVLSGMTLGNLIAEYTADSSIISMAFDAENKLLACGDIDGHLHVLKVIVDAHKI